MPQNSWVGTGCMCTEYRKSCREPTVKIKKPQCASLNGFFYCSSVLIDVVPLDRLMQLKSPFTFKGVSWYNSQRHFFNQVINGRASSTNADITNKTTVLLTFSLVLKFGLSIYYLKYVLFAFKLSRILLTP